MSASLRTQPTLLGRNAVIVGGVLLAHGAALWALNQGLLRRAVEVIVPVQIMAELIVPPAPPPMPELAPEPQQVAPPPPVPPPPAPAPKPPPKPQPKPKPKPKPRPAPAPAPAPIPLAVADAPAAAPVVAAPPPAPPAPAPAPEPAPAPATSAPAGATNAGPAQPVVVQPSTNAAYLNNPEPPYPAASRRLGETGRVVIRALIGANGRAQEAHVQKSSGFERLDQASLETVLHRWRFTPGTRDGVPTAMWVNVPINWTLND